MAKYRKKPVEVEAFQWFTDTSLNNVKISFTSCIPKWLEKAIADNKIKLDKHNGTLIIDTLEGPHISESGDYIIKGVKGELYSCKPDIFEMTYEKA